MKRREFFKQVSDETLRAAHQSLLSLRDTFTQVSETVDDVFDEMPGKGSFFDSYEMSYSLTLAYPREMFEQMARENDISWEGVETIDIVRELHALGII